LISVVTDYPLGDILRNQDATGRISKWAVKLGALKIDFKSRTSIKSQALVHQAKTGARLVLVVVLFYWVVLHVSINAQ
jgi:hypothetical protein